MRLEALPFEVDYFGRRPGRAAPALAYFLTHAHADHLHGLASEDDTPVHCTAVTSSILAVQGFPCDRFVPLALRQPTRVMSPDGSQFVATVTALPANHCLGACMFLFEGPYGRVLHTGDFRFNAEVAACVRPLVGTLDTLLIDCTFCNPALMFPSQAEARDMAVTLARQKYLEGRDIFIGGDRLGKEDLYAAMAEACDATRVYVCEDRYKIICAGDPALARSAFRIGPSVTARKRNPLTALARPEGRGPFLFVVPWWAVSSATIAAWSECTGRPAEAILPTACGKRVVCCEHVNHVPYSSHSNFDELRDFVSLLRPRQIHATDETSHYIAQDGLVRDPTLWFAEYTASISPRECVARRLLSVDSRSVSRVSSRYIRRLRTPSRSLQGSRATCQEALATPSKCSGHSCVDEWLQRRRTRGQKRRISDIYHEGDSRSRSLSPALLCLMQPAVGPRQPELIPQGVIRRQRP